MIIIACHLAAPALAPAGPGEVKWKVEAEIPHDPDAFTQGLLFHAGALYESTGKYGRSSLRKLDPATGRILKQVGLPAAMFGEGLALWGEKLVQLTWKRGEALYWHVDTLAPAGRAAYPGQGWGLAELDGQLVMSDGSCDLFFRNPEDFSLVRRLTVRGPQGCVANLNELETVHGLIWSNIWHSDSVAVVNPMDGRVLALADFSSLRSRLGSPGGALNGLAWNPDERILYVTGKNWPRIFKLSILSAPAFAP